MKETRPVSISLEEAIGQLRRLPPEPRDLVVSLIGRLAQAEGVSAAAEHRPPAEQVEPQAAEETGPHFHW